MKNYLWSGLVFIALVIIVSCAIPLDSGMSAIDGRDFTIGIVGCGETGASHILCRVTEGGGTGEVIRLIFPPLDCSRASCVEFQFWRKDNSPGYAGSVKKGQTEALIRVSDIVGHADRILSSDDGEYSVSARGYFTNDGQEFSALGDGFVRLLVLSPGYKRLSCGDPNSAWSVEIKKGCTIEYSSRFRSTLCGKCD